MNVLDYMLKYSRESVYWKDTQGRYLGCNQVFADIAGVYSPADLIGKTDRQLFINFLGDEGISAIEQLDQQVIMTGREIVSEEVGIDSHSQLAIYISNKNPLRDEHQRIIGVFGISFNIADKYHAEALRITNQRQIEVIQSQEKLAGIAAQVVHDIASPLASLKMLVDCSKELAEPRRVALQKVARSIEDITKQLLNQYNPAKIAAQETEEEPAVFLPGLILQDLIEDRMMRYRSSRIQFELEIPSELYFEGLHAQRSQFMRMISNLINNAIDAMNGDVSPSEQIIRLKLSKDHEGIHILIQDTGCGMTQDQVHKIMNAVSFSHGKAEGHGIGFTQIRKMLANNQGRFSIDSKPGVGTTVKVSFPVHGLPNWSTDIISLLPKDLLIIADDEQSIHDAWDQRLQPLLEAHPQLKVVHFMEAREAAQYIKSLAPETFQHLFLLTDYEFINQSMTGVDIVLETKCRRSLVVTNHFAAKEIQGFALKASTSLLPKPLVHRIPITVETPHSPAAGVHEAQSQSPHKNQRQSIRTPSRPSLTHP